MLLDTKLLRQKVLDLAIKGQLVPQLDSEPAVEQLGQAPEDVSFEIPKKWKWVSLRDVGTTISGGTPKTSETSYWGNDVSWITPADLGKLTENTIYSGARSISYAGLKNSSARLIPEGSVVYSSRAPIGHIAIAGKELTTNQGCKSIYPNTIVLSSKWTYFTLIARTKDIQQRATGTTFKEISAKGFAATLIPLPPLAEQKRIVAKVEELFAELDAIDKAYSELEQLGTLSKSKILDLAVKGQLVPQLDSEPAVERIGKAPEDVPFDIPEKWKFNYLGEIVSYGTTSQISFKDTNRDTWVLDLEDIEKGTSNLLVKNRGTAFKSNKVVFKRNDVLYSKLRPYLNKVIVADEDGVCTSEIIPIDTSTAKLPLIPDFLKNVLMSPYFVNYANMASYGVKMPRLSTKDAKKAVIPIPPLEEQKRIVAKVEELFALIDAMKK